ncbi:hypothetical protein ABZX77_18075 [Streptomyces sp. NPDC004237]
MDLTNLTLDDLAQAGESPVVQELERMAERIDGEQAAAGGFFEFQAVLL